MLVRVGFDDGGKEDTSTSRIHQARRPHEAGIGLGPTKPGKEGPAQTPGNLHGTCAVGSS